MLTSFCKGACAIAAASTLWAGAAQADNQSVLIVEGSYFPSTIYAKPGDNVIFTNQSGQVQHLSGPEDTWTSGPIEVDATYRLNLTHATPLTFTNGEDGEGLMEGEISYDPAPLND
ncbi:hypothetical protein PVW51_04795 [Sulfitobacter sp. PR48]|jgi:plastocyanin|uniref:hypothetical protein n=1 Tax=unclassified Sulfitobacter TaxID=196795 RepID=UPI0022AEFD4A|nr:MULTISPECIES: hypothetical protein [unclassified Sulfitobacter]MCZ4254370.1 hypothetical protein [Sulfitobacter sp. G21635-S1]MDD9719995.1 hypothetical protein [Sulfitobacter sp. PR48]